MNRLPAPSAAARLAAFFAAALVTLTTLSGIDSLAVAQGAAVLSAQRATLAVS